MFLVNVNRDALCGKVQPVSIQAPVPICHNIVDSFLDPVSILPRFFVQLAPARASLNVLWSKSSSRRDSEVWSSLALGGALFLTPIARVKKNWKSMTHARKFGAGVLFLIGAVVTVREFARIFSKEMPTELWNGFLATENEKERMARISRLGEIGDEESSEYLRGVCTRRDATNAVCDSSERSLDQILERAGLWRQFQKEKDRERKRDLLREISHFSTRRNTKRMLSLRNTEWDHRLLLKNIPYSDLNVFLSFMVERNPVSIFDAILEENEVGRAEEVRKLLYTAGVTHLSQAHENYLKGRVALAEHDGTRAVEHLSKAVQQQPELEALHYWLGEAHVLSGTMEEAVTSFNNALKMDTGSVRSYVRLISAALRMEDTSVARKTTDKLMGLGRAPYDRDFYRGLVFLMDESYERAVENFSRVLARDPDHYKSLYNRALACYWSGQLERSENDLRHLIEPAVKAPPRADSDEYDVIASANLLLAIVLQAQGEKKWEEAKRFFERNISMQPLNPLAHYNFGRYYAMAEEDYSLALEYYRKALALHPGYYKARIAEALALLKLDNREGARNALLSVAENSEVTPEDRADSFANLSDIALQEKNWNEASRLARQAIETDSNEIYGFWNMGEALLHLGESQEALRYLRRAQDLFSQQANPNKKKLKKLERLIATISGGEQK